MPKGVNMKFKIILFFGLAAFLTPLFGKLHILDGTVATAYNPEGNILIKLSD